MSSAKRTVERMLPAYLFWRLAWQLAQLETTNKQWAQETMARFERAWSAPIGGPEAAKRSPLTNQCHRLALDIRRPAHGRPVAVVLRAQVLWLSDLIEQGFYAMTPEFDEAYALFAADVEEHAENVAALLRDDYEAEAVELAEHFHRRLAQLDYYRRQVQREGAAAA